MLRQFLITGLAALAASNISCSGNNTKNADAAAEVDSIAADSIVTAVAKDELWPDTTYQSAAVINYSVEIIDSAAHLKWDSHNEYEEREGVLTFRGGHRRDANYGGRLDSVPTRVEKEWSFQTAYDSRQTRFGVWGGGSGWTGQPLYIAKTGEIAVGSLCSNVYFIDFKTGKATRPALPTHNPIKGTISLDPKYDNLYVGQGVPGEQPFGAMVFDLKAHKEVQFIGRDPKAMRGWNAFDSSPVVAGGFLFWPGENGALYKYARSQGKLYLVAAFRYRVNGMAPGIENSLCVYGNHGFFGDNRGNVICINLQTMHPVWHYNIEDDVDGSIVCSVEDGVPYLYAGCEIDKRGAEGMAHLVKLNARNGKLIWQADYPCKRCDYGSKTLDGGFYCTPLLGTGDCKDLLFANICRNGAGGTGWASGQFLAIDKRTGKQAYVVKLRHHAWSSPVSFMAPNGEMYVFTGDAGGYVYLIKGSTGEVIFSQLMANNFESSPVVVGNVAVVGTRQNGIHKFVIR